MEIRTNKKNSIIRLGNAIAGTVIKTAYNNYYLVTDLFGEDSFGNKDAERIVVNLETGKEINRSSEMLVNIVEGYFQEV